MDNSTFAVGKSFPKVDSVEKATGKAKYGIDLKLDGMLHAKLLRSPRAHARVTNIDTSEALRMPGVRAIATIEEVPKVVQYWFFLRTKKKEKQMYLLDNIVRFVGDPVLAVAAVDEETAEEAISRIRVTYEPLEPVFDPIEAIKGAGVSIHEKGNVAFRVSKLFGDIEKGFKDADLILENRFHTSKQKHTPLEPIGTCLADYGPDGRLTVYSSTQLPHWSQMYLAGAMGLPMNRVRVIKPYTGGAFGGRCGLIHGLEVMNCWLSRKAGRPVRMSFSRREEFIATESRHPMTIDLKTGVTRDGVLVANEIRILADVGGYGTHYIGVIADCLSTGVGLYNIPNVDFQAAAVFTNTCLCGAFRGYGNPQMNFAQESQMDMIADKLGMDPVEFRLKNYRRLGEIDPVFDDEIRSNGLEECLEKGAKAFGWNEKLDSKTEGSIKKGRGIAVMLHGTGAAKGLPDPASATVMINADGTVNLVTAAADDGQGNRTVLAQIASEILGIEMEKIGLSTTDTSMTPLDGGTHGSRQTYCGGLAAQKASEKARKRLLEFASKELGAPEERLEIRNSGIFDKEEPENTISVADLMRKTQITDMSLCEQIVETFSGVAPSMPGYYGANFAKVEVDTDTGQVRVIRLTGAFDVGKAINPAFVEGQITGGSVMGVGWALTEDLIIEKGEILNGSFTDYRLLRANDVPKLDSIIVESHEPTGPFGAKGVGEGSMVCVASAIANAVYDAVGVRIRDLPITPEKILRAMERSSSEGSR
ncbi:MAG: molybdopterin-dependent oxidoreductase [Deltaproteobacteria bacterium]|nr:molybdopterin-dependent oxidoreductase [Deltaproteobacteria bacterium]